MTAVPGAYADLVARWDRQQAAYIARREARFDAILDTLETAFGERFTAVDLACGPGSLAQRILRRFPEARVVAIDYDPMLLAIAQAQLAEHGERVQVIDADLTDPSWPEAIEPALTSPAEAMVSTTALHWLAPDQLVRLYREAHTQLAPQGLLLNGDHFRFDAATPHSRRWAADHDAANQRRSIADGADDWDRWWSLAAERPEFRALLDERERRFDGRGAPPPTTVEFQLAALRQAGFAEVGTVWQLFDDYVVYGVSAARG